MPRKAQTQEKFRTISIEESVFQNLHKNKQMNEPIYQTAHRAFYINTQSEIGDIMNELTESRKRAGIWMKRALRFGWTTEKDNNHLEGYM